MINLLMQVKVWAVSRLT